MLSAALIITYALSSNAPLYIRNEEAIYQDTGVRLELHKPLPYDFYLDLDPYVWKSKEQSTIGSVGAKIRLGWENKNFGLALYHHSQHDADHETNDNINFNAIEFLIKLK